MHRWQKAVLIVCLLAQALYSGCLLARNIPFEGVLLPESLPRRPLKPYYAVKIEEDKIFMVVHRGEKPTGGYAVEIFSVREDYPGRITVKVKLTDPDPGDFVIQAFTYPATAVAINTKNLIIKKPNFRFMDMNGQDLAAVGFEKLKE